MSRIGLIAFGSDQGMCGGFNEAISRLVETEQERLLGERANVRVLVIGRRLAERLSEAGDAEDMAIDLPGSVTGITPMLLELLPRIDRWRQQHSLQSVILCHNRRMMKTNYEPVSQQLLPVSPRRFASDLPHRWPGRSLPLITMPPTQLWLSIVRQFLFVSLFQACAESQASENAARIAAMQAAETHINERLGEFQLDYQQLRQTSITEELLDVITGFEALTSR